MTPGMPLCLVPSRRIRCAPFLICFAASAKLSFHFNSLLLFPQLTLSAGSVLSSTFHFAIAARNVLLIHSESISLFALASACIAFSS